MIQVKLSYLYLYFIFTNLVNLLFLKFILYLFKSFFSYNNTNPLLSYKLTYKI